MGTMGLFLVMGTWRFMGLSKYSYKYLNWRHK